VVTAVVTDPQNNASLEGKDDAVTDLIAATIDSVVTPDAANKQVDITGSSTDVPEGTVVTITITDSEDNVVTTTATVGADGTYSVNDVDTSGLVDGPVTVDTAATDSTGNPVTDTDTVTLDQVLGTITVDGAVDAGNLVDVSGTTTDVKPGSTVTITITDEKDTTVTATATVNADGSYEANDIVPTGLVDGILKIDVKATDRNGNDVTASDADLTDNVLDAVTATIDSVVTPDAANKQVD
ncbi:MAG: hypothetical protein Q4G44_00220, partial [Alcaligenaceae bacterium]|nr:hypothetical protein [Alcaligenaceae bacterium]